MIIGDVRVIRADIPVARPHAMSFTTLEAVNFVFVRLETRDGLVGLDPATGRLAGEDQARVSRPAIVKDRAGPAIALATSLLGRQQAKAVAQGGEERLVRLHVHPGRFPVQRELDVRAPG